MVFFVCFVSTTLVRCWDVRNSAVPVGPKVLQIPSVSRRQSRCSMVSSSSRRPLKLFPLNYTVVSAFFWAFWLGGFAFACRSPCFSFSWPNRFPSLGVFAVWPILPGFRVLSSFSLPASCIFLLRLRKQQCR